jgi:hypothetical protein
MSYLFKQAICLKGVDYHRGVHKLPGDVLEDPVFKKFLRTGLIVDQSSKEPLISFDSLADKNKKLAEKLVKPEVSTIPEPLSFDGEMKTQAEEPSKKSKKSK